MKDVYYHMWKKIKSLIIFQISIVLDNKIVFFYSLIMPLAYLIINLFSNGDYSITAQQQVDHLLPIVGYVCITGVLNGWVMGILVMRENSFLKTFTSIVGDKKYIFFANYLISLLSNSLQVILITVIYQVFSKSMSYSVLLIMIATALVVITVTSLVSSIILMMRMKYSSIPMILTTYILLGFLISNMQPKPVIMRVVFNVFDIYSFTKDLGNLLFNITSAGTYSIIIVILPIIISVIIGLMLINKIPVSSVHTRV